MRMLSMTVLLILLTVSSGCAWFIPSTVKREAAMMRTNVAVGIQEVQAQPDSPTKATALRALQRMEPHVVNWDNYVRGQKADRPMVAK